MHTYERSGVHPPEFRPRQNEHKQNLNQVFLEHEKLFMIETTYSLIFETSISHALFYPNEVNETVKQQRGQQQRDKCKVVMKLSVPRRIYPFL